MITLNLYTISVGDIPFLQPTHLNGLHSLNLLFIARISVKQPQITEIIFIAKIFS